MKVVTSARTAWVHWQRMVEIAGPDRVAAWAAMSRRDRFGAKIATAGWLLRDALAELVTPVRRTR